MDFLWDKITEWLKEMLIGGIVSNLSGMFDATNQKVAEISGQVGLSPQAWNSSIFSMIQNLSETVIVPIAGAILAFVMTLELIQLITDKNNLNDMPDGNVEVKAIFEKDSPPAPTEYTITVTSGGNGTASASHAKAVVGTEIRLTATPKTGYHLKEWQVISGGVTIKDDKFLITTIILIR